MLKRRLRLPPSQASRARIGLSNYENDLIALEADEQQIYQQVQLLPLQERLQLIRQLFAEAVKTGQFQLAGSMTANGDIDEMIRQQRADVLATLEEKGAQLQAELAE